MRTFKNSPFSFFLFLFSCLFVSSITAQQYPLFLKQGKKVKARQQAKTIFSSRVAGVDSAGFGGEPGVVWERMIGEVFPESTYDYAYNVVRLADGSFAISGSINTESIANLDGVIIKANADGQVLWKKRLGVRSEDFYPYICGTPDGGLVATGPFSIDSSFGTPVVKLNSTGQVEWETVLHQSMISNWGIDIKFTKDGGYLIAGDISKNITDTCSNGFARKDSLFNVLIKLDNTGGVIWEKKYFLGIKYERATDIKVMEITNGYLMMNSYLGVAQNNACSFTVVKEDIELMRFDISGNLLWSKKYGGSQDDIGYDIKQLPNSNVLILGTTKSTDGDLQGINSDTLTSLAWKLIVNDTGKIIDNKVYDLSNAKYDVFYKGIIKKDSSYMLVGISEFVDSSSNYEYKSHLLSLNKNGVEQWRAVYPGRAITAIDSVNSIEWMFTDIGRNTEFGSFGKLGQISNITGTVYYDFNKNNIKDIHEPFANQFLVTSEKAGYSRRSVSTNGWFRNDVDTGSYKTTVKLNNDYYVSVPAVKQTTFTTLFQNDTIHFALQPVAGKRDLSISLIPVTPARPGFNAKYKLTFRNNGTDTVPNGGILLIKDSKTTLVSSMPAAGLVTGDSLIWMYAALKPFDSYSIDVEVKLAAPPTLNNGDTLRYKAFINSTTGSAAAVDLTPSDDTANVAQLVTGSYDPNDKQENLAGKIPLAKIVSGEDIQYVVRFQNTGTDTAFTVRITDTLDAKLNWNSLQMISASHPYKMTVVDGNKISWAFNNINLPDSNVNEPLSHGYVAFRIKAKSNLSSGEYFQNKASIYFDYNLPVLTNTAVTVVSNALITNVRDFANKDMQIVAMPNPSSGSLYLKLSGKLTGRFEYSVIDLYGRVFQTKSIERNNVQDSQLIPLQLNNLNAGVYYIVLRQKEKVWQQKIILH